MLSRFELRRETIDQRCNGIREHLQDDILGPVEPSTGRNDDLDIPGNPIKCIHQVTGAAEVFAFLTEVRMKHSIEIKKKQFLRRDWIANSILVNSLCAMPHRNDLPGIGHDSVSIKMRFDSLVRFRTNLSAQLLTGTMIEIDDPAPAMIMGLMAEIEQVLDDIRWNARC